MRRTLVLACLLAATPALADDHDGSRTVLFASKVDPHGAAAVGDINRALHAVDVRACTGAVAVSITFDKGAFVGVEAGAAHKPFAACLAGLLEKVKVAPTSRIVVAASRITLGGHAGAGVGDKAGTGTVVGGLARPGPKPREVVVAVGRITVAGGHTEDEARLAISRRTGVFRACYRKELNRTPGLAGTIALQLKVGDDGRGRSAAVTGGTLKNAAVEDCLKANAMHLQLPPKGSASEITFSMAFSAEK
jgi:hypothetical protein